MPGSGKLWVNVEELGVFADSDYAYDACKTASYLLWSMSGRKFSGVTTVTERYVSQFDPYLRTTGSAFRYWPTLVAGAVTNVPVGGNDRIYGNDFLGDGTSSRSRVRLRGRKVIKIHTVRDINGNIIDPRNYYLAEHSTLYGTPNTNWNPANVEVTYTYGTPPPSMGKAAARMFAIELIKFYEGDDTCALPQRVTSVNRQGVSYTILDQQDFIEEGKTGIYTVDLFLKAANPDKARARARVFTPDTPRARRIQPKPPLVPMSSFDLFVPTEGGSVQFYTSEINSSWLAEDQSWTITAVISDIYNEKQMSLSESDVDYDSINQTIRIGATYQELLPIIGPRDPGVLDLYAVRPSLTDTSVDEVVNISTSNVFLQLGERVSPIITI
jgi:hypothetical protein